MAYRNNISTSEPHAGHVTDELVLTNTNCIVDGSCVESGQHLCIALMLGVAQWIGQARCLCLALVANCV
jgi:hypothetical protein